MNERISVDEVITMAVNDLDLQTTSYDLDKMYEWAFWAELAIGSRGNSFIKKECELTVTNYRATLPSDFFQLVALQNGHGSMPEYNGRDFTLFSQDSPYLADRSLAVPAVASNYNFQDATSRAFKFTINSNYLDISLNNGKVGISYYAIPVDAEGRVTICAKHANAVSHYLQYKLIRSLYMKDKISRQVYMDAKAEWKELNLQAYTDDEMPTLPELDYAASIWNNRIPFPNRNSL